MNVTPKTLARQITVARHARENAPVVTVSRLAFTSETGVIRPQREDSVPVVMMDDDDAHCFVCGRHTDHFAEHDDMVEAGTAEYRDGNTYPIPW